MPCMKGNRNVGVSSVTSDVPSSGLLVGPELVFFFSLDPGGADVDRWDCFGSGRCVLLLLAEEVSFELVFLLVFFFGGSGVLDVGTG